MKEKLGSRIPYCLCSPLKGSFNQRPVARHCEELRYGDGLEEGRLETGKHSLNLSFLPGGLVGKKSLMWSGAARHGAANSISMEVGHSAQS